MTLFNAFTKTSLVTSVLSGADPAIFKRGLQLESHALISPKRSMSI